MTHANRIHRRPSAAPWGAALAAWASAHAWAATIATDRGDYAPGDQVVVTGAGWEPGEPVSLVIVEDPVQHDAYVAETVADDDGNVHHEGYVVEEHDLGSAFTLTATGGWSGQTAQASFSDSHCTVYGACCRTCSSTQCLTFDRAGTSCRGATGPCDREERCSGTSAACPADTVSPVGTVCRQAGGVCDVTEVCDGVHKACPPNARKPAGTVCRAADGPCDAVETCSGTSNNCPGDARLPAGTVCRPSAGDCDVAETCAGNSDSCPGDAFRAAGTVCRASSAPDRCDDDETCSGASASCPADDPPDTSAPTVSCPAGGELLADAECSAGFSVAPLDAGDDCDSSIDATCDPAAGTLTGAGSSATSTCSATDASGNTGACATTFTLVDRTAPTIECSEPQVLECVDGGADASVGAAADDNCGVAAIGCEPGSGFFPLGSTGVACAASDGSGNTAACTTSVTVVDTVAPAIECSDSATVATSQNPGQACSASLAVSATADDVCAGALAATCSPATLTLAAPGTASSTCGASDGSGNASACSASLTLVDDTPPTVSCTTAVAALWPPNHALRDVGLRIAASDNCGGATTASIVGVTSDEPTATAPGAGGAAHSPDAVVGGGAVQLRAERSGSGDGRVYRITVSATDAAGNRSTGSCTVRVDHSQGRSTGGSQAGGAIDSGQNYDATQAN